MKQTLKKKKNRNLKEAIKKSLEIATKSKDSSETWD